MADNSTGSNKSNGSSNPQQGGTSSSKPFDENSGLGGGGNSGSGSGGPPPVSPAKSTKSNRSSSSGGRRPKVSSTKVHVLKESKDVSAGLALGNNNNDETIVICNIKDGGLFSGTDLKIGMELINMEFMSLDGKKSGTMNCKGKTIKEIAEFLRNSVGNITLEVVNPGALEIIKGVTPHVIDIAKKFPLYGKLVKVLDELIQNCKEVKANKEAFRNVAFWSKNIKAAMFHAAPVLLQVKDVQESLGSLTDRFHESVRDLYNMSKLFCNRHYIIELITSADFKRRFDDAKPMATALLISMQLTIKAVQIRYASEPGPKQDYMKRVLVENVNAMRHAALVAVRVDEELDNLIEEQHKSLELLNEHFLKCGNMDVNEEVLLELIGQVDPARYQDL